MLPTNIYSLIAWLSGAVLATLAIIKGLTSYFENEADKKKKKAEIEFEKTKLKEQVEIARYNAEVAKHNADILTASQVIELMKATNEVKGEIANIKKENENRDTKLTEAMDELEGKFDNFELLFKQLLITRANQFDQLLINKIA